MYREFEPDFVMRQIRMMVEFIARLLFHSPDAGYHAPEGEAFRSAGLDRLWDQISALLAEDAFNEAENLLFDAPDGTDSGRMLLALDFYTQLSALPRERLMQGDFPPEEILMGLRDAAKKFAGTETGRL